MNSTSHHETEFVETVHKNKVAHAAPLRANDFIPFMNSLDQRSMLPFGGDGTKQLDQFPACFRNDQKEDEKLDTFCMDAQSEK